VRRYLVVANLTLGGDQLLEKLRERMEAGPCHFHVLVPATPVAELEPHLVSQDPTKGGLKVSAEELGWAAARQRLHQELLRLRRLGAEVDGEVGEADPVAAIKEVMAASRSTRSSCRRCHGAARVGLRGTCRVGSGATSGCL